jgi:hypothetical protein
VLVAFSCFSLTLQFVFGQTQQRNGFGGTINHALPLATAGMIA